MGNLNVQIRSEENGLAWVDSIEEAMKKAEDDISIWKISWTDKTTNERIRLVRVTFPDQGDMEYWVYEPIKV